MREEQGNNTDGQQHPPPQFSDNDGGFAPPPPPPPPDEAMDQDAISDLDNLRRLPVEHRIVMVRRGFCK